MALQSHRGSRRSVMNAETRERARQLFTEALRHPAMERDGYLDCACNGDLGLREHVGSLLAALVRADDFLAAPTIDRSNSSMVGLGACAPSRDAAPVPCEGTDTMIGPYRLLERIG